MITALLLLTVGIVDLVRLRDARVGLGVRLGIVLLAVVVALVLGAGWAISLALLLVAAVWSVRLPGARGTLLQFLAVAAAVVVSLFLPPVGTAVTAWLGGFDVVARIGAEPVQLLVALGVLLVVTQTANRVCQAALDAVRGREERVRRESSLQTVDGQRTIEDVAKLADAHPLGPAGAGSSRLRGGRVIGPLERGLLVVLGVFGVYAAIGGIVAAKGIVRFPEIASDTAGGSKAEEFLVGSLVSWALAGFGAWLVIVAR